MTALQATYAIMPDEYQLDIRQETLTDEALPPHAVLIQSEVSVISAGTELAIYSAIAPGVKTPGNWNSYPWRPGYGAVGRVLATGSAVERVEAGDRVFFFGKHASHQIYDMASGKPMTAIFKVPEDLPPEKLVMLRMALIAIHAPQLTQNHPADTVAIFGLGIVGNLTAQLYKQAGLRVIGLDPIAYRCELARRVGVDVVFDVPIEAQLSALHDITGGRGADITVEAVGHSAVVQTAIQACADFGQVVLLGSPRSPHQGDLTTAFRDIHLRGLTVLGALEWRLPPYATFGIRHSVASNLERLIMLMRGGQLDVEAVTSHIIHPQALHQAYEGLLHQKDSYLGTIVDWRIHQESGA